MLLVDGLMLHSDSFKHWSYFDSTFLQDAGYLPSVCSCQPYRCVVWVLSWLGAKEVAGYILRPFHLALTSLLKSTLFTHSHLLNAKGSLLLAGIRTEGTHDVRRVDTRVMVPCLVSM